MMEIKKQISEYIPYNDQEKKDKQLILKFIDKFDNVLTRENIFGHFSSSAFVVNEDKTKVLMIYHKIYDSWAWPGGHADGESDFLGVAIREVMEETGIKNVEPLYKDIYSLEVLSVNGHIKREEYISTHFHINTTFLLEANETEKLVIKEDENSGVKWVDIDEMVSMSTEPNMKIIYQKIIDKINNK